MSDSIRLSDVATGKSVFIKRVKGQGAFRQRILEMGFVKGKKIKVIKNAPLNDPIEFNLLGYNVSLRRKEASMIEVSIEPVFPPCVEELLAEVLPYPAGETNSRHIIRVALVGNPNSGKTTIFNHASKSREHVGNYTGVTVTSKTAVFKVKEYTIQLTDLPGTYSMSIYSPEEQYVRDYIIQQKPDVVINIVDATNLERNLFLTTQLIDMNIKVIVALNMFDELIRLHDRLDYDTLGKMLGIPFVPTIGARGKGITKLFRKVVELHTGINPVQRFVKINYGTEVEHSISQIQKQLPETLNSRYLALRLLENDLDVGTVIDKLSNHHEVSQTVHEEIRRIESLMDDTVSTVMTDARYGFIAGALKETYRPGSKNRRRVTDGIDRLLTNKYLGLPVFLLFMWVMFSATFNVGAYPQTWIENGVGAFSGLVDKFMADGSFKQLLSEGIIGGVGGVIVFLPNILILFFFISIMEDTGYMARAAFITDKLMHKIGLHGKSFIPLIMGFGCNVPAIMATRTIENRNNRLLTMLINPFMSCSARLPVYVLLIGAVFPAHRGTMLFLMYITGIVLAAVIAMIFKHTLLKSAEAPFVMELPPYRVPTLRSVIKHMWMKSSQYLRKMGGIIMVASVLIWALGHYPVQKSPVNNAGKQAVVHEDSYIARIGKFIEPAIQPLGFDWKMGVCLISGIAAKEIVVSTMGVLYDESDSKASLQERISNNPDFTPLVTLSFLLFTLLYFPCVASISAIFNESGSWKWALFSLFFTTGIAWVLSFLVYQTGMLLKL